MMTASNAGTVIRGFIGKLLASETSSIKMFDAMNLSLDGTKLNFERFSNIAKDDVNDAIQILLDNFGKLSSQQKVLQKMFTARHWTKISALLASMGGNVREFTDTMTSSNDVGEDYEKQMKNMNNQLTLMDGKIANANASLTEMTKDVLTTLVPMINWLADGFSAVTGEAGSLILKSMALSTILVTVSQGIMALNAQFQILAGIKSIMSPQLLAITAVVTALSAVYFAYKDVEREQIRVNEALKKEAELRESNRKSIELSLNQIEGYEKALKFIEEMNISEKWNTEIDMITLAYQEAKKYKDLLGEKDRLQYLDKIEKKQSELNVLKSIEAGYSKQVDIIDKTKARNEILELGMGIKPADLSSEQKIIIDKLKLLELEKAMLTEESARQDKDEEILKQKLALSDAEKSEAPIIGQNNGVNIPSAEESKILNMFTYVKSLENTFMNKLGASGILDKTLIGTELKKAKSAQTKAINEALEYTLSEERKRDVADMVADSRDDTNISSKKPKDVEELRGLLSEYSNIYISFDESIKVDALAKVTKQISELDQEIAAATGSFYSDLNSMKLESDNALADYSKTLFEETYKNMSDFMVKVKSLSSGKDVRSPLDLILESMNDKGLMDKLGEYEDATQALVINSEEFKAIIFDYYEIMQSQSKIESDIEKTNAKKYNNAISKKGKKDALEALDILHKQGMQIEKMMIKEIEMIALVEKEGDSKSNYSSKIYEATDLQALKDKYKLSLMDEGLGKLKLEEKQLADNLKLLEDKASVYDAELKTLNTLKSLGTVVGNDVKFDKKADSETYKLQLDKVKELDDVLVSIENTNISIAANGKAQAIELEKQNKENLEYTASLLAINGELQASKLTDREKLEADIVNAKAVSEEGLNSLEIAQKNKSIREAETKLSTFDKKIEDDRLKIVSDINKAKYAGLEIGMSESDLLIKHKLENEAIITSLQDKQLTEAESLKIINAQNALKTIDLAIDKAQTSELEKQLNLRKQSVGSGISAIEGITSGKGYTPSYNSSGVASLISNVSKGGYEQGELTDDEFDLMAGKDLADTTNFAITQFANVMGGMNSAEQLNISRKIELLEMEKMLLTDESDIQAKDEEILREKLNLIDKEAEAQAISSIAGGATAGIATTAMMWATNPIMAGIMGGVQLLGGLFGASSAEKDAEYQKEMLELQENNNQILEDQTKALQSYGDIVQGYVSSSTKYGSEYALENIDETLKVQATYKSIDIHKEGNALKTWYSRDDDYISASKELHIQSYADIDTAIEDAAERELAATTTYDELALSSNSKLYNEKLENSINTASKNMEIAKQEQVDLLELKESFADEQLNVLKSYYGYSYKWDEDLQEFTETGWSTRETLLNSFIDNAKTGFNDLGSIIADTLSTGYMNVFVKENTEINTLIKNLEDDMTDLVAVPMAVDNSIITDTEALKAEQYKVNQAQEEFTQGWIDVEGKISDVSGLIKYGLYDGIMGALDETEYSDRFNAFGSTIGDTIASSMKKNLIDDNYAQQILDIENQMTDYLQAGVGINMDSIYSMAMDVQALTSQTEMDTLRMQNAMSAFEIGDISYINQSQGIQYDTGTSSSTVYQFTNNVNTNIGNMVSNTSKADLMQYANLLAPSLVEVIEQNLGKKFS